MLTWALDECCSKNLLLQVRSATNHFSQFILVVKLHAQGDSSHMLIEPLISSGFRIYPLPVHVIHFAEE